ncbi:MAG: hypothetical protein SFX73_21235 [Kofleriaceae bacterium]|nr:hypothetical protein [Kofleriaceae bacterium]
MAEGPRRYFVRFGMTTCALGGALLAVMCLGLALGALPTLAAFFPAPLMCVGGAMCAVPGPARAETFEPAWLATPATIKLVWLAGFAVGVLAMMQIVFFMLAPASAL